MPPHTAHQQTARYGAQAGGSRREVKPVSKAELEVLPSMDSKSYYDLPTSPSSSSSHDLAPPSPLVTNSGNKLRPAARWIRRGKIYPWGPSYEDVRTEKTIRKRLKICLEQLLPEAAVEAGGVAPQNISDALATRRDRKRKRAEDAEYIAPHLASPSPPTSTIGLAPMLALPKTYLEIMLSPSMRHTLGSDTIETGLQRTAAELLEGEKGLMQALGRLREVLRVRERDVPAEPAARDDETANGLNGLPAKVNGTGGGPGDEGVSRDGPARSPAPPTQWEGYVPPLPHISETDNLWRVTQELLQAQPQPTITFTITPPGHVLPPPYPSPQAAPNLTPVHRLFTCPTGITINSVPPASHPGFHLGASHQAYPQQVRYNLDLPNQCRAVDDALERIGELLADCNEYKERLEEARDRMADVARARKRVWGVLKERAALELDRADGEK